MKKKVIIISVIVILLLVAGIAGYFIYQNMQEEKEKEEEELTPKELYADFIKDYDFEEKGYGSLGYTFLDLDNDNVPELLTGKGDFTYGLDPEEREITIYSIVEGAVKEVAKLVGEQQLCFVYDIANDKYLYGLADLEVDIVESYGLTDENSNITKIKVIENKCSDEKEYDVTSKEYKEKYITIPGSEDVLIYSYPDVIYEGDEGIKSDVRESFDLVKTKEDYLEYFYFDIEDLKTKNESNLNAPTADEASAIGKELYDYIKNFSSNVELGDEDVDIGTVSYAREILDYEGQFESKFTENFIEDYFSINNAGPGYIEEYDGKMYFVSPGIGGRMDYIGEEMVLDEITDTKITFKITGYFFENMDDIEKEITVSENYAEELKSADIDYTMETTEFVIVKDGDTWKISEYEDLTI